MRGFFGTIPKEIVGAARVDGCSDIGIFFHMYLPLSFSALLVVFLLQFTWIWNDLLFGLVLGVSDNVRPIMPSLTGLMGVYKWYELYHYPCRSPASIGTNADPLPGSATLLPGGPDTDSEEKIKTEKLD